MSIAVVIGLSNDVVTLHLVGVGAKGKFALHFNVACAPSASSEDR